jgi:hypothetical protein
VVQNLAPVQGAPQALPILKVARDHVYVEPLDGGPWSSGPRQGPNGDPILEKLPDEVTPDEARCSGDECLHDPRSLSGGVVSSPLSWITKPPGMKHGARLTLRTTPWIAMIVEDIMT